VIIKDLELQGVNYGDARVTVGRYDTTKTLALALVIDATGEPLTKITVNLPQTPPQEGYFWLKSWGENEGLLITLGFHGLIEFDPDHIRTVEMNAYGSLALEVKPKGELKEYIEAEVAKWTA
jgi:hypothetical protein